MAERYCGTVDRRFKPCLNEYDGKWELLLPWFSFQLRQILRFVTHFSPHELASAGSKFPRST